MGFLMTTLIFIAVGFVAFIMTFFDAEIKKMKIKDCYFPLLASLSVLQREKDHIEGFAPEVPSTWGPVIFISWTKKELLELWEGPGPNSSDKAHLMEAIPGMLLALVLCFDHRKGRDSLSPMDASFSKGHKYIWFALAGYAIGLVTALAAGILTHSPQPALLYLVPSTLGPVIFISWTKKELLELWEGPGPNSSDKAHLMEV
ncbi:hypothetical protein AAC387_Pa11g0266 [Persea americana]